MNPSPAHEQSWTIYGQRQLDYGYTPPVPERIDWGFWPAVGPGAEVLDAVTAGLTLPWSSGVVDGHVNRVKTLKRAMYGRASFTLLRTRVLTQP
ncbi:hypothetical protein [Streptomyces hirsutus]|uniref:hypothetical protein n=1 Tax=Streptomyces hirsutus TaxID=35620 RepID=UPI00331CE0BF